MTRARISTLSFGLVLGVLGLVLGVTLAGAATAQMRVKEKVGFAVTGEITAVDAAAKTVTVKSTNDDGVVYAVGDGTTIMSGARKLTLGDLAKGQHVALNGQDDGATKLATYIKVVKAP